MAYDMKRFVNDTPPSISSSNLNRMEFGIYEGVEGKEALKNETKLLSVGNSNIYPLSNFKFYGLNTNGTFKTDQKYRCSCTEHIIFSKATKMSIANGFRWGYIPFTNGVVIGSWSGWKTSDFVIPANTECIIQIARVTEDFDEVADVALFTSALTFKTELGNTIDSVASIQSDVSTLYSDVNDLIEESDEVGVNVDALNTYTGYEAPVNIKGKNWGVGYVSTDGFHDCVGMNNNNSKRIVQKSVHYAEKALKCNIAQGYRFQVSYYSSSNFSDYEATSQWLTGEYTINQGKYYCLGQIAETTDTTNITDYRQNGLYDALTVVYADGSGQGSTTTIPEMLENAVIYDTQNIEVFGNSLTMGHPVYQQNWVKQMESLIDSNYNLHNHGISGEGVQTIGGRQGGIPMLVNNVTIPDTTTAVEVTFSNILGGSPTPIKNSYSGLITDGVNPCYIAGIKGTLSYSNSKWYFTREESGSQTTITRPTMVVTESMKNYRKRTLILWTGENGEFDTEDDLVKYEQLITNYNETPNVLVIGRSNIAYDSTYHTKMLNIYGQKYINITEYLCLYGLDDAGITPTADDISRIASKLIPASLLADYPTDVVHLNATGYGIVANVVYKRGVELGYWT